MNNNKLSIINTIVFIACALPAGLAVADVSSDRVDTYKSNKLLPSEVQIATVNSVASNTAGVAVFSLNILSWNSYSNAMSASVDKFLDWTKADFEAFFADYANAPDFEEARNALSQFGNDHVQGAVISDEDALALLQNQFNTLVNQYSYQLFPVFPCEGLDFTGLNISYIDFSNCTGLTGEQLASTSTFAGAVLPAVDFTGVDLTSKILMYVDFSQCTGLTGEQLASASTFEGAQLPAVDFTGVDLSFKNLRSVDFSQCTGLTGEQLAKAMDLNYISLTSTQYEAMKTSLPSGTPIYVDNIRTIIP